MNLEGLNVVISANINEFNNSMSSVSNQIGGLGGRFAGFATLAGTAIAGVVTALGALATATATVGVKFNATHEQSMVAWTTLLGGAQEAETMLERITQFAKITPFDVENVDMMAKYMHNAGLEGEALFDQLMRNSDVASAFAISGAEAKEFTRQMSQVQQAGVAMTEDLNILQDRGIPIYKELGKVMGVPVSEVKKLASESKITSDIYMTAFNNIAKEVEGASEAQSKTFNGMVSAMGDNLKVLAGLLSKPLFDKLKEGLQFVLPLIEKVIAILKDGGGATDILKALGIPQSAIDFLVTAFNTIKSTVSNVFDWYKSYIGSVFSGEGNVGESFVRIFNVIKNIALPILQDAVAFIKEKIDQIKTFWDENGASIIQAVQNAWSIIAGIFEFIAPVIMFIVQFLWDSVKGIIDGALNIIMGLIKIFAGLFTGDFGKMWEGVKQLFMGAVEFLWNLMNLMFIGNIIKAIKGFATGALNLFKTWGTNIKTFFTELWENLWKKVDKWVDDIKTLWSILRGYGDTIFQAMKQIIKNIWDDIVNGVKTAVTAMKDFVVNIFNGIKTTGQGIFNGAKTIFMGIWNGLKEGVGGVVTALKDTVVNIFNGIKNASSIWEALKNTVMSIINGLKSGAESAFNGLKTIVGGIFDGIKTAITKPIEGAKTVVLGIIDAIKGAFSKMNITIPKPKLPKVSVSMKKGVMGIPYPDFDVSWYAKGGLFNGPSVIGVGEAGTEAVVPLQGHRMKPFAETIAKMMPAGGTGGGGNLTVHVAQLVVREEADIKRVAQELHGLQQRETRQGGRG